MSSLTVPFMMPSVEEVVPDFVMLKDRLTGSSVVEERYTSTQVPSSGDTYSVGGTGSKLMIIRVSNQNDYIDTSTMCLNFKATAANSLANVAIDDHIFSCVDTINVKVGGQTVEVLNNVGHLVNALVQGSMPSSYYSRSGQFEGLYVYDKTASAAGPGASLSSDAILPFFVGATSGASVITQLPDLTAGSAPKTTGSSQLQSKWQVGSRWLSTGRYYSVPLTMLGICRLPTLFAARNFQDITIEILFRSGLAGAVWQLDPTAAVETTVATGSIAITDVTLTYDCCRMSADYYALMDNELKMPNGSGVAYPIDTYQVQAAGIASSGLGATAHTALTTPALTRIVVAKGTRFLKGVYGTTKVAASESSPKYRNNSTSGNFAFNSYQVIINSKRYPQLQIQSTAQAYQELQKAYNLLGSVAGGSQISWYNYCGHPFKRNLAAGTGIGSRQDLAVGSTKDGTTLGMYEGDEAMFQLGVNLEQFLSSAPDAGGINTSTSGYQIAVELGQLAAASADGVAATVAGANLTHYVMLHFTRILTLKAGAVEILD